MKNIGTLDRLLRMILAEICVLTAFFWAGKDWQIVLYLIAAVMLFQAATGVCGFYQLLGWNTCQSIKRKNKNMVTAAVIIMVAIAGIGIYGSSVLTANTFQEDLNVVREPYDLTLNYTGQEMRSESIRQFERLEKSFSAFQKKYEDYRPLVVKFDSQFTEDLQNISAVISASKEDVYNGSLKAAHQNLLKAKPAFQKMQERNSPSQNLSS